MAITLHHPEADRFITVTSDDVAAVHEESGWVRVDVEGDEPAGPARPADGAPARKWVAYAQAIGLEVDPAELDTPDFDLEALLARIQSHEGGEADPTPKTKGRKPKTTPTEES